MNIEVACMRFAVMQNSSCMNDPAPAKPTEKRGKSSPAKPGQSLPSNRIAFEKQTDLIRAWGLASGNERKAVPNKTVADIAGMNEATSFQLNGFLQGVGFLTRGDGGFVASSDVVAYATAAKWNDSSAPRKLAPTLRASWFGKVLVPRLGFRSLDEKQAMLDLAAAAGAGPEYRSQIKMCIDYLEFSGLLERDGGMLKEGPAAHAGTAPPPSPQPMMRVDLLTGKAIENKTVESKADAGDPAVDVTAEALTRLLKRKPSKAVQDAIWTLIRFLTIGEDDQDHGGEP